MSIRGLLVLIVFIFALFVLFAHAAIEPWWGILGLALALLIGEYLGDRRL